VIGEPLAIPIGNFFHDFGGRDIRQAGFSLLKEDMPTFESVNPEEVSHMSYIHPISLLPKAWRKMIQQREKALNGGK